MASLARTRRRHLFLLPALLCLALLVSGCDLLENDGTSKVPGVELIEQEAAAVAAWSPDGRRIAFPIREGIALRRPGGAVVSRFEAPPLRAGWGWPAPLEWVREGRFLRYVTTAGPNPSHRFWLTVVFPDGSGLEQTPLLSGNEDRPEEVVLSPDGRQALFAERALGGTKLWVANTDGTDARVLAQYGFLWGHRFSPDGPRIAFDAVPSRGRSGGIYVMPAAGGKPRRVSAEAPFDGPTWSPDGRWLAYSTEEGEIRRVHPDGSGDEKVAGFGHREVVSGLNWSPNGRTLLYSVKRLPNPYDALYSD